MMSLSAEYCKEKTGVRDGRAFVQQRRLVWGLLVWSTLLTLILAASITFQIIHGASAQVPSQEPINFRHTQNDIMPNNPQPPPNSLVTFQPDWEHIEQVEQLRWKTNLPGFIEGKNLLKIEEDGLYFIYMQVTLDPREPDQNYNVKVQLNNHTNELILIAYVNRPTLSTGLMGKGTFLTKGDTLNVICTPKAKIKISAFETYLGVIKL